MAVQRKVSLVAAAPPVPAAPAPAPTVEVLSYRTTMLSVLIMILGPLFLIYLMLRCEKNQCVLLQFPLVVPMHLNAFWSPFAQLLVLAFITFMFLLSVSAKARAQKPGNKEQPVALASVICTNTILITLAWLNPDYINTVHEEYLRLLVATTLFSIIFSGIVFCLTYFKVMPIRDRIYTKLMSLFYGNNISVSLGNVELKYFLYVRCGMVAWALLDVLIVLEAMTVSYLRAPLIFLAVTQLMVIVHDLLYENIMLSRPFVKTEGLGFFWLMKVVMYQPFLHSLPLYYVAAIDYELPGFVLVMNCGLFLVGYIVYISSIHQRFNFSKNPGAFKNLQFVGGAGGKQFLTSGYWGVVQKPDYFGYLIMCSSWIIACGVSAFSLLLLFVMYSTIYMWLNQSSCFKQEQYGPVWVRYIAAVPKKIIPFVF